MRTFLRLQTKNHFLMLKATIFVTKLCKTIIKDWPKRVKTSGFMSNTAIWCFDVTLNPALNWPYLLIRPPDLNQICTRPRSGQDPGLVKISLVVIHMAHQNIYSIECRVECTGFTTRKNHCAIVSNEV